MGMRKDVPHARCSPLCAIKEKLQALWDRAYGCINQINDITPDGDGKFTIQGGQNISITPISNGLAFDADYPSGVLTINGQTPDADGDISGIATTDQLTDGSVTKVGTANVGTDTKPIKLVDGVPTAVTNDLVDTSTAQTITAGKTFTENITTNAPTGTVRDIVNINTTTNVRSGMIRYDSGSSINKSTLFAFKPGDASLGNSANIQVENNGTDKYVTASYRAYNSANVNDVETHGSAAANPNLVHTVGNETINGTKKFNNDTRAKTALTSGYTYPGSYTVETRFPEFQDANGTLRGFFQMDATAIETRYVFNLKYDSNTSAELIFALNRSTGVARLLISDINGQRTIA